MEDENIRQTISIEIILDPSSYDRSEIDRQSALNQRVRLTIIRQSIRSPIIPRQPMITPSSQSEINQHITLSF